MIPKNMSSYGISTRKPRCRKCKIPLKQGFYCEKCKEEILQEKIDKKMNRRRAKLMNTFEHGIKRVYSYADRRFWSTNHANCFRATFGRGETKAHMDKMYERWKHHRSHGRIVYCNLILKDGRGRPDLTIVDKGFVFIEEIVKTEKEASLIAKKKKYPFPINIIRVRK